VVDTDFKVAKVVRIRYFGGGWDFDEAQELVRRGIGFGTLTQFPLHRMSDTS